MTQEVKPKVTCPACRKTFSFPQAMTGRKVQCPNCKSPITLPAPSATAQKTGSSQTVRSPADSKPKIQPEPSAVQTRIQEPPSIITRGLANTTEPIGTIEGIKIRDKSLRFLADGQNPNSVSKILDRLGGITTPDEELLYLAVQQKPVFLSRDAIALSNRRVIIFRPKMFGRLSFFDVLWLHISNIHLEENLLGATISVKSDKGRIEQVKWLPKVQARRVYQIGQQMEEEMIERRRLRRMEEARNAAAQLNVQTAVAQPTPQTISAIQSQAYDRLSKLRELLSGGLITQEEFDKKKTEILGEL